MNDFKEIRGTLDVSELMNELLSKIETRRRYLKVSQEQLANLLGTTRQKILKVENREAVYTLEEYLKCCIILDLPFELELDKKY